MKRMFLCCLTIIILLCGCAITTKSNNAEVKIKEIAVGEEFSIFLTESGEVYSVGNNRSGNLGVGDTEPRYNPEKIETNEKISRIGAGEDCAYAIAESGNIYFWGSNRHGQMGDAISDVQATPKLFEFDTKIEDVSIGWNHILCMDANGTLYSWGANEYNELGVGASISEVVVHQPTPVFVEFLDAKKFVNMSAGATSSMAVSDSGDLYVWGEVGVNLTPDVDYSSQAAVPIKVEDIPGTVKKAAAGFLFELVLLDDGTVYGRGRNDYGQISSNDEALITVFQLVPLPEKISDIVAGKDYAFAISETGNLYAWGNNAHGQLGLEQPIVNKPTQVRIDGRVVSVSTFSTHTFVTTENGGIYAMGKNDYGQLNNGTQNRINVPTRVSLLREKVDNPVQVEQNRVLAQDKKLVSLSSGYAMSIAMDEEADVYSWGISFRGCLGHGGIDDLKEPTKLELPHKAVQVDTNTGITAILLENGDIYMCGSNMNYRLGTGSELDMWIPTKIDLPKPVKRFFNGQNATFAQTEDNDWYVWGDNSYGILATGDLMVTKKPTRNEFPFKVNKISSHNSHSLFLDDAGSVYMWGHWDSTLANDFLMFNKVDIKEKVVDVATSWAGNFILTDSGKVYSWGDNTLLRLGLKDNIIYESPVLIEIDDVISKIAVSPVFSVVLALTPEGNVYTWGYDILYTNSSNEGSEFLNTPFLVDLPEPIVDVFAGDLTVYAISESGAIYTWGGTINSPDGTSLKSPTKMQYSFIKK